jgi:hypothetical protein
MSSHWGTYADWAVAGGTFSAVLVALFGRWIRKRFFPPKLEIALSQESGQRTQFLIGSPDGSSRTEDAVYYHIVVSNKNRRAIAHDVRVFMEKLETLDASQRYQPTWVSPVPIRWELHAPHTETRKLGPPWRADLCSVVKDKWLELHPFVDIFGLKARWRKEEVSPERPIRIRVSVQARSLETDSNLLLLEITWDGVWEEDSQKMAGHFSVHPVEP